MNNLYGLLFAGLFLVPVVTRWRLMRVICFAGLVAALRVSRRQGDENWMELDGQLEVGMRQ
jgi:hypothetical protein